MKPLPRTLRTAVTQLVLSSLLVSAAHAQQTDALPMKNLRIELRQMHQQDIQTQEMNALGDVPWQSSRRTMDNQSVQQSLVLNGHPVRLMHGNTTPWALYQSYLRNGVVVVAPSTVWVRSGTGFIATPRWKGDGFVELDLQAQSALGDRGFTSGQVTQQSNASQVLVPLNEWITVAGSDTGQDSQQSGIGQMRNTQTQGTTSLQVRISLP